MKSMIVGAVACMGALLGSADSLFAQVQPTAQPQIPVRRPEEAADPANSFRAKDVIGMTVRNAESQEIGTVEDLVIDSREGRVLYAVMTHSSLASRDQLIITPWNTVQFHVGPRAPDRFVVLNLAPAVLLKSPIITRNQWPNIVYTEWPTWRTRIDTYYRDHGDVRVRTRVNEKDGKIEQRTGFRGDGVKGKEEVEIERKANKEEVEVKREVNGVKEKAKGKVEVEKDGDVKIEKKVEQNGATSVEKKKIEPNGDVKVEKKIEKKD